MQAPILVINPNSSESVTQRIDEALASHRFAGAPPIECVTLVDAPRGIESQADSDRVIAPLCALVAERSESASAFVIACFSDPGLLAAREITPRPVFGIAESAILTALAIGNRFGILSILDNSIPRHERAIRASGLGARFAGDLAIGFGVSELADEDAVRPRMEELGGRLRDDHRADVIILGCSGMAEYRERLQQTLEVPVIDPTQAAVTLALGAVVARY